MISLCRSLTFYLFFFPHCKTSGNYGWSDRGGPSLKDLLLGRFLLCHKKKKENIKDHLPSQHILSFFLFVLKCHYFWGHHYNLCSTQCKQIGLTVFLFEGPRRGFQQKDLWLQPPSNILIRNAIGFSSVNKMSLWWVQFPTGRLNRESKP